MYLQKKYLYELRSLLSPIEIAMLNCLFIYQDRCGEIQVSRKNLQLISGLPRDKARKATKLLQEKNIISIKLQHFNGKQRDSIYKFTAYVTTVGSQHTL